MRGSMSKKQYIETFSDIHPSDEFMERIMCMKDKRQNHSIKKAVVVLAVAVSVLFALGAVAYAATDGEIMNTVVNTFDLVAGKVYILVNGEETEAELNISEQVNEDGETVYYVEMGLPFGDGTEIEVQYEGDVSDIAAFDLYIQHESESVMQETEE